MPKSLLIAAVAAMLAFSIKSHLTAKQELCVVAKSVTTFKVGQISAAL
ncbi:MAG: hypothetical protein ACYS80_10885 [Planctomycetota bacterium]